MQNDVSSVNKEIKVQDISQKNAKVQTIILKNKDRKQMWNTIKTLDANEQEIEEIGRKLIYNDIIQLYIYTGYL